MAFLKKLKKIDKFPYLLFHIFDIDNELKMLAIADHQNEIIIIELCNLANYFRK